MLLRHHVQTIHWGPEDGLAHTVGASRGPGAGQAASPGSPRQLGSHPSWILMAHFPSVAPTAR
jgi:hypothetical protein